MNKTAIVSELTQKGFSAAKGNKIVNAVFDLIGEELANGETVKILRFGTFRIKNHPAHQGWNPYRKKPCDIPARNYVYFKPAPALKEKVKEHAAKRSAEE